MVHGIITTFDSIPLIGLSIKVLSSKQVVFSDSLGKFTINCLHEDKIRVYDIGYGHISEENKSNAVVSLNTSKTDFSRYSDLYDLIRGQFAGVEISNGEIIIEATKSFQGSNAALIVLDGAIPDESVLSTISPTDVKTINVIKDASSSIYGTRGMNGVVIIETKKGGDK